MAFKTYKTYGRYKHRIVKTEVWISPEINKISSNLDSSDSFASDESTHSSSLFDITEKSPEITENTTQRNTSLSNTTNIEHSTPLIATKFEPINIEQSPCDISPLHITDKHTTKCYIDSPIIATSQSSPFESLSPELSTINDSVYSNVIVEDSPIIFEKRRNLKTGVNLGEKVDINDHQVFERDRTGKNCARKIRISPSMCENGAGNRQNNVATRSQKTSKQLYSSPENETNDYIGYENDTTQGSETGKTKTASSSREESFEENKVTTRSQKTSKQLYSSPEKETNDYIDDENDTTQGSETGMTKTASSSREESFEQNKVTTRSQKTSKQLYSSPENEPNDYIDDENDTTQGSETGKTKTASSSREESFEENKVTTRSQKTSKQLYSSPEKETNDYIDDENDTTQGSETGMTKTASSSREESFEENKVTTRSQKTSKQLYSSQENEPNEYMAHEDDIIQDDIIQDNGSEKINTFSEENYFENPRLNYVTTRSQKVTNLKGYRNCGNDKTKRNVSADFSSSLELDASQEMKTLLNNNNLNIEKYENPKDEAEELGVVTENSNLLSTKMRNLKLVEGIVNLDSGDVWKQRNNKIVDGNNVVCDDNITNVDEPREITGDTVLYTTPVQRNLKTEIKNNPSFVETLTPLRRGRKALSAKEKILLHCSQRKPLKFNDVFTDQVLKSCVKVGEGTYGEVFKIGEDNVLKVIPIEGQFTINDEEQKTFEEILPEIVISRELSDLGKPGVNSCPNFINMKRVILIQDSYPEIFLKKWDEWSMKNKSENQRPDIFPEDQYFVLFEFNDGGQDLESFKFTKLKEALSVLQQIILSFSVAEKVLKFEHRDLHWGNVLIKRTRSKNIQYKLNGDTISIESCGVFVSVIDFTLSRLTKDAVTVFCDLSKDPDIFTGKGDFQFEVYRLMREANNDEWRSHLPYSNILWFRYLLDKMLNNKKYEETDKSLLRNLRTFLRRSLTYNSSTEAIHDDLLQIDLL